MTEIALGPDHFGTNIGVLDRERHIEVGFEVVGRKFQREAPVFDLDGIVERPTAGVVGKLVLENDLATFAGRRRPSEGDSEKQRNRTKHSGSCHERVPH